MLLLSFLFGLLHKSVNACKLLCLRKVLPAISQLHSCGWKLLKPRERPNSMVKLQLITISSESLDNIRVFADHSFDYLRYRVELDFAAKWIIAFNFFFEE